MADGDARRRPGEDDDAHTPPRRVLTLDASGLRSFVCLGVLQRIETLLRDRYERPNLVLSDYFDMIVGAGVTAHIAGWLSLGHPVDSARTVFHEAAAAARGRGPWRSPRAWNARAFAHAVRRRYGERALGALGQRTGMGAVIRPVDASGPRLVAGSAGSELTPHQPWGLADLVAASAGAGPFDPSALRRPGEHGTPMHVVNAGWGPAADPTGLTAVEVTRPDGVFQWPAGEDRLFMMSVGAGRFPAARTAVRGNERDRAIAAMELAREDARAQASAFLHALTDAGLEGRRGAGRVDTLSLAADDREDAHSALLGDGRADLAGFVMAGRPVFTYRRIDPVVNDEAAARWIGSGAPRRSAARAALARAASRADWDRLVDLGAAAGDETIDHADLPHTFNPPTLTFAPL